MSVNGIILATAVVAIVGIVIGIVLGAASIKLHVNVVERVTLETTAADAGIPGVRDLPLPL